MAERKNKRVEFHARSAEQKKQFEANLEETGQTKSEFFRAWLVWARAPLGIRWQFPEVPVCFDGAFLIEGVDAGSGYQGLGQSFRKAGRSGGFESMGTL